MHAPSPPRALRRRTLIAAGAGAALGLPTLHAAAQQVDLSRVTLRVGDQIGLMQGWLAAAGLLADVPYKIEWSQYPAAVNLHEALRADATDIGGSNDSPTVSAIAGGSKIRVVAAWKNGGRGTALLVPKGSKATKVADLRGKVICPTTRGSVAHFLVVGLLKEAGIPLDAVQLAYLSPNDAMAALRSGSIDAWATWSIFRSRAISLLGAREIDDGLRINSGVLLLTATDAAVRDPGKLAAIRHFSALLERSYVVARANRTAYVDWFMGFAKQDRALAESVYDENVSFRRVPVDDALVARLAKTYAVWVDNGVLSGTIDFNTRVLRDDRA